MRTLTRILRDSIEYGLDHRQQALDYAMDFGRGLDTGRTDRFESVACQPGGRQGALR